MKQITCRQKNDFFAWHLKMMSTNSIIANNEKINGGHLTEVHSSQTREKLLATIILHLFVLLLMEIQPHEETITGKRVKSSSTFCERLSYSFLYPDTILVLLSHFLFAILRLHKAKVLFEA